MTSDSSARATTRSERPPSRRRCKSRSAAHKQLQKDIEVVSMLILSDPSVPPSNQLAREKAAAMYQACMSFASSKRTETKYLVEWMISLNLDLLKETRLATVNPVEMMVRGSLDLGVETVISIVFSEMDFVGFKRKVQIEYSSEQDIWFAVNPSIEYYERLLSKYGAEPPLVDRLAVKISGYDMHLEWSTYISKYTNGTYTSTDIISHLPQSTSILLNLFESESVGIDGLRYLVAWSIYRQLVKYTEPHTLRRFQSPAIACYDHIKKVMNLAVISSYFTPSVPPRMVYQTKRMASRICSAFEKALNTSSWIGRRVRDELIYKLIDMTVYVGSQGRRYDPAFVEEVYKPYPDVPREPLFPTWIKALSLSSHYIWTDQNALLYNEAAPNAFYINARNDIIVSPGIMQRPLSYLYGPVALNYAGLGMILAHEIMHAFDVEGMQGNKERRPFVTSEFIKEYTKRAVCLRRSHKSVLSLSRQQGILNDTVDSENLADVVGTMIAYAAYSSMPAKYKDVKLVSLNISAERLFFINHCVKWCAERNTLPERYAPFRSRCIVPLMNMPEFSRAFGCAEGTPMNPRNKCTFW
ncbi:hypothetical protein HPB52_009661 [Rhipicephalus sanguineus]|uniref:Peptidase M13 C-terminal domain-containing protein n=1 Tax=Rhipicephalus sanguineus TaxID=34632 RepID=A0A9D4SYI0_RHISA|nr:hypothetical protein HPB52_009661 [Rhipicephalus sanguineus]